LYCQAQRRQEFSAATVVDRLVFFPVVLVPLAVISVFPQLLLTPAILEAARHWSAGLLALPVIVICTAAVYWAFRGKLRHAYRG
jgi:hypothetical protein